MLVRQQVLLPDWLIEHFKFIADRYNISFSEMIRIGMCMHLGNLFPELFPDYKCDISSEELADTLKSLSENEENREQFEALKSKIFLEARKAVKYRSEQKEKSATP